VPLLLQKHCLGIIASFCIASALVLRSRKE
jgi:hypothetical protein